MSCPDLSALARVGTTEGEPEVVEHLKKCDSCLLDWQIQLGTRYLSDPQIDATAAVDLDERIIARATAITRHSERLPGWRHLAVAGLLAAAAAFAFVWTSMGGGGTAPVTDVVLYAMAGAVATVLYLRRLDQRECSGF
jgi:hypothetical protein